MFNRQSYLDKLIQAKDSDFVKVLTGVRRCGKSTLLMLYKDWLLERGVEEDQVIEISYEKMENEPLKDGHRLHAYLRERIPGQKRVYLLIDEAQEIQEWAKVINSLKVTFNADIYVTGSNSSLFSGEYLTYLSGRYIEIKVYPLSFREFLEFKQYDTVNNLEQHYQEYIRSGSFPAVNLVEDENLIRTINQGLFDSIFSRDIISRGEIREIGGFYKVAKFVFDNIGNSLSTNKIANTLRSEGSKISHDTVDNYLMLMCDAYILYQCSRYDIRGKELLRTNGKYYIVDMGLRNQLIGYKSSNMGHDLENIVFLELIRRGYQVFVGKNGTAEIDFIAERSDTKMYIQVSLSVMDEQTKEREFKAFDKITDNYPKWLITMDRLDMSQNGILHKNVFDFLLEE